MNLKTVLGWLTVAFIIWWVIESPSGAAHVVHNIGTFLTSGAHGISDFFSCLGSCPAPEKGHNHSIDWGAVGIFFGSVAGAVGLSVGALVFLNRRKDHDPGSL